uniref:50S ribosomal protein L22 n=1 Tax=uncultured thaumarchaeote Rifle_16ft_4_minimus_11813 TaxID=1665208 RepID=A0A0H4T043_9ARCH|nr:50S ribosomal protein L22, large subunit ribosomal protein L22 [uncultured thaumarchaeote Rifle_16ft_4_minimus_11813]
MPEFGYSFTGYAQPYVKASGREVDVSPKATREVCQAIKGMTLAQAKEYLEVVADKGKPVPFRRYKHKVGQRGLTLSDCVSFMQHQSVVVR